MRGLAFRLALTSMAVALAGALLAVPATSKADRPTWVALNSGTKEPLFGVSFGDTNHGYAVGPFNHASGEETRSTGASGVILATSDGGRTWAPQSPPRDGNPYPLTSVSFPDARHGHAVGGTSIIGTSDGGRTWAREENPQPEGLDSVWFTDPRHGYAVGSNAAIVATADGGRSWASRPKHPDMVHLKSVAFSDADHGFAVGTARDFRLVGFATADAGRTWSSQDTGLQGLSRTVSFGVSFPDGQHGHVIGSKGQILATADGGDTWDFQRVNEAEQLLAVSFFDSERGVAVGQARAGGGEQRSFFLATDDSGKTWTSEFLAAGTFFTSVDFADATTAYAVNSVGGIIRITFPSSHGDASGLPLPLLGGIALGLVILVGVAVVRRRLRR